MAAISQAFSLLRGTLATALRQFSKPDALGSTDSPSGDPTS
jgi:hypothetical protein